MKELFLVFTMVAIIVYGFFIMKKLDSFLKNNRLYIDEEKTAKQLVLAFDNPMIINSLTSVFEKFSKNNPECTLCLFFGTAEEVYEALNQSRIDFGFIQHTDFSIKDTYNRLTISAKQGNMFSEDTEYSIKPLSSEKVQTTVIWKRFSDDACIGAFADLLTEFEKNKTTINS